ncbi:jun transcription factor-related [Holotrichia oblita]|uniref:Jun transcription factor-related n=1 Tax=Holotrichia oblita TaxID=644536 RepID=A0ACB9SRG8_HOLOL|nr:jun transcription factor-related [Holotrichia oblita]
MGTPFQDKNINNIKQNLKLDFNQKKNNLNIPVLLSPSDLNMLKVNTPDLEKMILSHGISTSTPTPSATGPLLFPKVVTEEQENFATGFVDALNNLHNNNSNSNQGNITILRNNSIDKLEYFSASDNSSSTVYTDLEQPANLPFMQIKEEPQSVPCVSSTPPLSPVDMEYQERMKLERKRQRNRLAASKCRSRKLERISKLEDKVKSLKAENNELGSVLNQLKEHVGLLKAEVVNHYRAGCDIVIRN